MGWKVFEARKLAPATMAAVAIQAGGRLSLNRKAHELLMAKANTKKGSETQEHVELMFDADRRAVGIRRAAHMGNNTYPLRKQPRSESYLISARAFLRECQIELTSQRHTAQMEGDILVFVLDAAPSAEPAATTKTGRKKKG